MKELILEILGYFVIAAFIAVIIVYGMPAYGQVSYEKTPIEPGCFISYETSECQEPGDFFWRHYGRVSNEYAYGAPVGQLLTTTVRWIRYAKALEVQNRRLRAKIKRKHGTTN